jgi:catechol 2,3-dioxygenase-like lactoylglutathione lyase family enzyme
VCEAARARRGTIGRMTLRRMDHVGIVVDDLAAAMAFFSELGLEPQAEWSAEDERVDLIVGLEGVRTDMAMMQTPDGAARVELVKFQSPSGGGGGGDGQGDAPANVPGLRHLAFLVDDVDWVLAGLRRCGAELVGDVVRYGDTYRLCYVRGPAGIIIELAEEVGAGAAG